MGFRLQVVGIIHWEEFRNANGYWISVIRAGIENSRDKGIPHPHYHCPAAEYHSALSPIMTEHRNASA